MSSTCTSLATATLALASAAARREAAAHGRRRRDGTPCTDAQLPVVRRSAGRVAEYFPGRRHLFERHSRRRALAQPGVARWCLVRVQPQHQLPVAGTNCLRGVCSRDAEDPVVVRKVHRPGSRHEWGPRAHFLQLAAAPQPAACSGSMIARRLAVDVTHLVESCDALERRVVSQDDPALAQRLRVVRASLLCGVGPNLAR